MQTSRKHYYKPRKSAVDISVSINVMSRNCEGFRTFAPQTPINGFKYLAAGGKQNGPNIRANGYRPYRYAKELRMAKKPITKQAESTKPTNAQIAADLTRAKIAFQLSAIIAAMGGK